MGATTLLVDEDTCATNFIMREGRMARLVETEPITPFLHRWGVWLSLLLLLLLLNKGEGSRGGRGGHGEGEGGV